MSRFTSLCIAFSSLVLLVGCSPDNGVRQVGPYSAKWVRQQIQAYEMPVKVAASQVTAKIIFADEPAYLIPSPCCDNYDYLYDAKGVILCAPSGGFTGRGDGSCPQALRAANSRAL